MTLRQRQRIQFFMAALGCFFLSLKLGWQIGLGIFILLGWWNVVTRNRK